VTLATAIQPANPIANVAVCGRFHYHNHIRFLDEAGVLNRFYYAARISVRGKQLGLPESRVVNGFLKEYAVHLHARLLGDRWRIPIQAFFHDWWQRHALKHWSQAGILHTMLHGNSRLLIARAHQEGSLVIGEPVNSHPDDVRSLLNEEHQLLGIPGLWETDRIEKRLGEEALTCDYLLAGSQFVADSFARHGFPAGNIHVIPYGVDLRYFSPLTVTDRQEKARDLKGRKFRVICVAQIVLRKGHVYLLEAWKQLKLPEAELLLIGRVSDAMRPVLARYKGWFTHIPHVPNHSLREHYCTSDVFALPSIEDGFAYACAEAMGCGLPVITTMNTGAAELLDPGINGFIVPIRSASAIAEKIELLYRHRQQALEMGHAAELKARAEMGWDLYAEKLVALYRQIFKAGPRRTGS
jgi:glycosyltransferase involved in cell wall biosynthesis